MTETSETSQFEITSFLDGANAGYIEQLYARFSKDPQSVDREWADFFSSLGDAPGHAISEAEGAPWKRTDWPPKSNGEMIAALDGDWPDAEDGLGEAIKSRKGAGSQADVRAAVLDSIRALMLIRAYRIRGHLMADLDPLKLGGAKTHPELKPEAYGFTDDDMDRPIYLDYVLGVEEATLREILAILHRTYATTMGVEFMHISNPEQKSWLQARIEGRHKEVSFTPEGKKAILKKLIEAEGIEKFLHVKYTGTKRFGLDGGESLVPAMEQIIKRGGNLGVKDIVLGMPHRGRLSILANVMGKPYRAIFNEFQGGASTPEDVGGSGDVKYHLGTSSDREFDGNNVHLSLAANPSHLEAVNPVVIGKARAKQDKANSDRKVVMPILLHGDAAFAGQGVVAECFGLSGLGGYRTGGTFHIIVNNQIGFTTSPQYSRSSPYPSDMAKMVEAPIFHVNGDDPEAVVHAAKVATEFRQLFQKDVILDIFCYRRFGHNEGDEPMFTQPLMYKKIKRHPTTVQVYGQRLVDEGLMTKEEVTQAVTEFQDYLADEFEAGTSYKPNKADWLEGAWEGLERADEDEVRRGTTAVDPDVLQEIGRGLTTIPDNFHPHRTIKRLLDSKRAMFETGQGFDWSTAEAMAFGALLLEGRKVRLSGQDCCRGTFSQRHSKIVDQENEMPYYPLQNIRKEQGNFEVIDSMLSEFAVLGFEYGYSWEDPESLVLWEAQFGDFANGAQVIFDQFIAAAEKKWLRMSGLVVLLPHGYEGQGPEHSSAKLERFLQLCAEDNMQVANCTTPANYFHILRRQLNRKFRKPLIMMTPKSLLRHKKCVSSLDEFELGSSFHRLLWDDAEAKHNTVELKADTKIKRVVLCTGKVYYDLLETRETKGVDDVYLMRLEQIYPVPAKALIKELGRFKNAEIVWCQEEPRNMGAWSFLEPRIEWVLGKVGGKTKRMQYVGRNVMAATATGRLTVHKAQQQALVDEALMIK